MARGFLGLTPMFGEDGWCRGCGVPQRPQSGSIVLQRKSMKVHGGWVPYWQYDVICVEASVAAVAASRFDLDLRRVEWHASSPGDANQIVVPTIGESWFDSDELRDRAIEHYGVPGAKCSDCGIWRWMPLIFGTLPPLRITPALGEVDVAASPEWFGDGWKAFRQMLVRRELAEFLASASPRDFEILPVS